MKMEITFRNGVQILVDVTGFETKKSLIDGKITELNWTTPDEWTRKLHKLDLDEILCIVAVEEP